MTAWASAAAASASSSASSASSSARCFLALDFKQVEDGIAYGAPREESWLAAFGLTMTLVWIYLEMLRLFSILSGDD